MKNNISVVIITLNEAEDIERCILSAQKISSDIIVMDSESTDETVAIARRLGAKVFVEKWIGYGQNKNIGSDKALYDWILSIDADEILDDHLINSLSTVDLKDNMIYSMLNQLNYCGHWVRFTDWHPSYKRRLYNKKYTKWNTDDVHEGLIIHEETVVGKLKGKMLHYGYTSYDQLKQKTEMYAKLSAQQLYESNKYPSYIKRKFGPAFRFIKSYIFQLGILDGLSGYQISRMNAILVEKRYKYLDLLITHK